MVLDKTEYNSKAQERLEDGETYKETKKDPTTKCKNRLINLLKKSKAEGCISDIIYKKMYLIGVVTLKFYRLYKVHKTDIPFRPIVSSRGITTYEPAKEEARVLRPLGGKSPITLRKPRIL